jgi:adenylate kinase family enzyme
VVIVGNSGSGKTALADHLAQRLGVPHVELDAHYHRAGWTPTPPEEFANAVRGALDAADAAAGGWVVCGNYRPVSTQIWARTRSSGWTCAGS